MVVLVVPINAHNHRWIVLALGVGNEYTPGSFHFPAGSSTLSGLDTGRRAQWLEVSFERHRQRVIMG